MTKFLSKEFTIALCQMIEQNREMKKHKTKGFSFAI